MAKTNRGKSRAKRPARGKQSHTEMPVLGERYTPLLTREAFTFSRMRMERGGPRVFSAICFRGWVRA